MTAETRKGGLVELSDKTVRFIPERSSQRWENRFYDSMRSSALFLD